MHTLSTVFDHLGSYFVSRTYGFPSLWSFCQQQMQPTIMMTVTLLNSLAQLCRVLRLVSDCCTANFLNSKFLTHKLTSLRSQIVIACSLWCPLRLSSVPGDLLYRLVAGFTRFQNVQVAMRLSLYPPCHRYSFSSFKSHV